MRNCKLKKELSFRLLAKTSFAFVYFAIKSFNCLPHYSYPICSGSRSPGLAADMHFKDDVIAFIGPACAFALEPVARLAAYWNTPIITGMGDQASQTVF